jgi:hypothetical protein
LDQTTSYLVAALPSVAGYAWLARRVGARGGAVSTKHFGGPELFITMVLGSLFISIAFAGFRAPPHANAFSARALEMDSVLKLVIVAGMATFLALRGISVVEVLGLRRQPLLRAAAYALGLSLLAFPMVEAAGYILAGHLPKDVSEEQELVSLFRAGVAHHDYHAIIPIILAAVVIAPLVEEFLFRGYFYPVLKRYFGASGSAVLTSVLFALTHANVASLLALALLALCFTVAYEMTGSLLVPMGMHSLFNAANLALLYYLAPSS